VRPVRRRPRPVGSAGTGVPTLPDPVAQPAGTFQPFPSAISLQVGQIP
jgi:hypothetical protein